VILILDGPLLEDDIFLLTLCDILDEMLDYKQLNFFLLHFCSLILLEIG